MKKLVRLCLLAILVGTTNSPMPGQARLLKPPQCLSSSIVKVEEFSPAYESCVVIEALNLLPDTSVPEIFLANRLNNKNAQFARDNLTAFWGQRNSQAVLIINAVPTSKPGKKFLWLERRVYSDPDLAALVAGWIVQLLEADHQRGQQKRLKFLRDYQANIHQTGRLTSEWFNRNLKKAEQSVAKDLAVTAQR